MILKFSKHDILECDLIDVHTGRAAFHLDTTLSFIRAAVDSENLEKPLKLIKCRKTSISRPDGEIVAEISWNGSKPAGLNILGEKLGGIQELFGEFMVEFECVCSKSDLILSSTMPPRPTILSIPSRFDEDHVWNATPNSVTVRRPSSSVYIDFSVI